MKIATPPTATGNQPGSPSKIATPPSTPEGGLESRVDSLEARVLVGTGSPANVVSAPAGTLYVDTAGAATACVYVKQAGDLATGWVLATTAAVGE